MGCRGRLIRGRDGLKGVNRFEMHNYDVMIDEALGGRLWTKLLALSVRREVQNELNLCQQKARVAPEILFPSYILVFLKNHEFTRS